MGSSSQIELKSEQDLGHMREAGRLTGKVLKEVSKAVEPGVSTKDLDQMAEKLIRKLGGIPTFLGYRGYPASICSSVNEEVVHGIPNAKKKLKVGDIISIDVGVTYEGFVGDSALTCPVGKVDQQHQKLIDDTRRSLEEGIKQACIGNRLGDISYAIQKYAESKNYGVVRDFVGHGIGRQMHEEPAVPNYGSPHTGIRLEHGLVLALEPMLILGSHKVRVLNDQWTVVSKDEEYAAHFEHTVAITPDGPEVLTARDD